MNKNTQIVFMPWFIVLSVQNITYLRQMQLQGLILIRANLVFFLKMQFYIRQCMEGRKGHNSVLLFYL